MDKDYWLGRWKRKETGWHQAEAEPRMVEYFSKLAPTRVFVPLCGKSLDLKWLADHGFDVVGVEWSEPAVREFFSEHGIAVQETQHGKLREFRGGGITIFCGDFFEVTSEHLGKLGAVYDRAALIALPPEVRARYGARMMELIGASGAGAAFRMLQVVLERTPHDVNGPPFSVPHSEVQAMYGARFSVTPLSREAVESTTAPEGVVTEECVYELLSPLR